MCRLGVWMTTYHSKGFKPPETRKKWAWLDIFQPNWQNHKIAISPTAKIGSTPNFDQVNGPHDWHSGWSRMTDFDETRAVPSHRVSDMSAMMMWLTWQRPLILMFNVPLPWQRPSVSLIWARILVGGACEKSDFNRRRINAQFDFDLIKHSADTGVWRLNSWTNFDEIW